MQKMQIGLELVKACFSVFKDFGYEKCMFLNVKDHRTDFYGNVDNYVTSESCYKGRKYMFHKVKRQL